jgi:hypothetical protein
VAPLATFVGNTNELALAATGSVSVPLASTSPLVVSPLIDPPTLNDPPPEELELDELLLDDPDPDELLEELLLDELLLEEPELDPPPEELEEPLEVLPPDELLEEEDEVCTPSDTTTNVVPFARVTEAPPTSWCGVTVSSSVNIPVAVNPFSAAALPEQFE